jgi:subtilisin family serine protease
LIPLALARVLRPRISVTPLGWLNLNLSTTGGPHDGTTLVEQGFEALLNYPDGTPREGRALVISAGNAFAQDGHVAGTVRPGASTDLSWMIDPRLPADKALIPKNEMEVWYSGKQTLKVSLESQGTPSRPSVSLGPVALEETYEIYDGDTRIGRVSHRKDDPNNHDNQIDIRVIPLGTEGQPETWNVKLETESDRADWNVPFHAWIEQDDQGLARFDGITDSSCTLGSIACGESPLIVGAFDTFEDVLTAGPYEGSSAGRTRDQREKPDVSAPGVSILAARAQGGTTVMSGTSMAAPHVTGLVALLFQRAQQTGRGLLATDETRSVIITATRRSEKNRQENKKRSVDQWDSQLGNGRVNGVETVSGLADLAPRPDPRKQPPGEAAEARWPELWRLRSERQLQRAADFQARQIWASSPASQASGCRQVTCTGSAPAALGRSLISR